MDGTIIGQGSFVANSIGLANPNPGNASIGESNKTVIAVPSGADWISVRNFTKSGADGVNDAYFGGTANAAVGVEFYWQRGMAPGTAFVKFYDNAAQTVLGDTMVSGAFTVYDPSGQTQGALPLLSAPRATTASTNATQPVVSTTNTAGLSVGSVVRMSNTAQTDINGIDFVVGAVVANTSFTLMTATNALANVPGAIGGAGFYRVVNTTELFYPRKRTITNITQAVNAQVSTSIAHGLTPGQEVRFNIPSVSGMTQLNPDILNNYFPTNTSENAYVVSVVDDYNFTINVDTTSYTAFTFPTIAQQPSSFPEVTPFGQDTAASLAINAAQVPTIGGLQIPNTNTGILADSTVNTGVLGIILGSGGNGTALATPIIGPSGSISWSSGDVATPDTLYWVAGKSTYGGL